MKKLSQKREEKIHLFLNNVLDFIHLKNVI